MLFSCVTRAASCSFSLRLNVWRLRRAAAIQLSGRASRTLHVLHSTSSQNGAVASLRPNDSWPRDALHGGKADCWRRTVVPALYAFVDASCISAFTILLHKISGDHVPCGKWITAAAFDEHVLSTSRSIPCWRGLCSLVGPSM